MTGGEGGGVIIFKFYSFFLLLFFRFLDLIVLDLLCFEDWEKMDQLINELINLDGLEIKFYPILTF